MRLIRIVVAAAFVAGCGKPAATPTVNSAGEQVTRIGTDATTNGHANDSAVPRDSGAATTRESTSTAAEETEIPNPADEPKEALIPVAELIAQAGRALGVGVPNPGQPRDLEKAIELLEKALAQEPKNRVALALIVQCTEEHAMEIAQQGLEEKGYKLFLKSAEYLRRWRETGAPLSDREKELAALVYYNEACAFAVLNEPEKAIASLADAFDAGFNNLNHLDKDSDLNSLRDRDDYKKLREQAVARSAGNKEPDR
jgi:tetratricopeptide (TPR) repeat protein